MKRKPVEQDDDFIVEVKFGGWHRGDNHKPGRGFYFFCRCGQVGLGQVLPASAMRQWRKHARRCGDAKVREAAA